LEKVLDQISIQTGFDFLFTSTILKGSKPVNINVKNADLNEVLRTIFEGQPLEFSIADKSVVVSRKETLPAEKIQPAPIPQPITIDGQVTNAKGEPLVGVTVLIKGTNRGVITDANGYYKLQVNLNDKTLIFSCVGMIWQEVTINGRTVINVVLVEGISKLGTVSVVSTGYQTLPKERATGSFAIIDSTLFNRSAAPNILNRLNGLASGVYMSAVTTPTDFSNQGRTLTYMIRGLSTINSTQSPLVIVDGFPYRSTSPYYQDINSLNPDDIESITVLKDAAAASIWGARAGNGVLVITTKKGKSQATQFEFKATLGQRVADQGHLTMMSGSELYDAQKELYRDYASGKIDILKFYSERPRELRTRNFNWEGKMFQPALVQNYYLSARKANDKSSYYIGGSFFDEGGTLINTGYKKLNLHANHTNQFSDKIRLDNNFNISAYDGTSYDYMDMYYSYLSLPWDNPYDSSGNPLFVDGTSTSWGWWWWAAWLSLQGGPPRYQERQRLLWRMCPGGPWRRFQLANQRHPARPSWTPRFRRRPILPPRRQPQRSPSCSTNPSSWNGCARRRTPTTIDCLTIWLARGCAVFQTVPTRPRWRPWASSRSRGRGRSRRRGPRPRRWSTNTPAQHGRGRSSGTPGPIPTSTSHLRSREGPAPARQRASCRRSGPASFQRVGKMY